MESIRRSWMQSISIVEDILTIEDGGDDVDGKELASVLESKLAISTSALLKLSLLPTSSSSGVSNLNPKLSSILSSRLEERRTSGLKSRSLSNSFASSLPMPKNFSSSSTGEEAAEEQNTKSSRILPVLLL